MVTVNYLFGVFVIPTLLAGAFCVYKGMKSDDDNLKDEAYNLATVFISLPFCVWGFIRFCEMYNASH
ncbi:hypothetical protein [Bacillus thuringiensis]|uniref:Uncharacterized protein n=1 Tax=Bacillus thuringiensis T01-328 TaxID=1324966 RepID=A0AAN4HJZ3_BACTU|nr:hypothetical protein [Bacillus thuringiensis]EEM25184.1 hypothetical protein bthur0002_58260 [Bacillus thuringiensis Bt407]MEC3071572.1 hypothetical protein [Bacillus cereus]PQZ77889.1 hypothetical protein CQ064_08540 [Bacillus sp. MYb78]ERI01034.1 hypothetical protein BTCBT_002589 [Bacillus thuringiensis T01-328]MBN6707796.1 hypothetical protein [Bacillus thuringiensis]